jgi:hypothetical protein
MVKTSNSRPGGESGSTGDPPAVHATTRTNEHHAAKQQPGPWPPPFQPAGNGWMLALAAGLLLALAVALSR